MSSFKEIDSRFYEKYGCVLIDKESDMDIADFWHKEIEKIIDDLKDWATKHKDDLSEGSDGIITNCIEINFLLKKLEELKG